MCLTLSIASACLLLSACSDNDSPAASASDAELLSLISDAGDANPDGLRLDAIDNTGALL
jgi:hypothetical protein